MQNADNTISDEDAQAFDETDEFSLTDIIRPAVFVSEPEFSTVEDVEKTKASRDRRKGASNRSKLTRVILAEMAIERALDAPTRRSLRGRSQTVVIVVVPTRQWLAPVGSMIRRPDTALVLTRDGSERRTVDADRTAIDAAMAGRSVVAITTELGFLPSSLVAAADHVVKLDRPDHNLLRKVIARLCRGPVPQQIDRDVVAVLDFDDLALLIKAKRPAEEVIGSLQRAALLRCSVSTDAPSLETMTAFGAARGWGLALSRDIAAVRRNEIGWSAVDRGAVIFGPPGTGKTLFASSLAASCRLPIVTSSISELFSRSSGDLGAVIKAQREVFARASAIAPSILFIDEIDAMPNRATISDRGRDWWLPVVNDFLLLLDSSISNRAGVIVLGATNRIEDVDAAILRPGRLERSVWLGPPDAAGLTDVLRYQLAGELAGEDLRPLAARCAGATPAVAMDWVRQARRAARTANRPMALADLEAAALPAALPDASSARRTAVHEAGHAVIALVLGAQVQSVALGLNGNSGGRTTLAPNDPLFFTRDDIVAQLLILLGGRAAEEILLGSPSSGAGGTTDSDLSRATQLIETMLNRLCLGDDLVYIPDGPTMAIVYDSSLRAKIGQELQRHYRKAIALLREHIDAIERVATALLNRGFLDQEELIALLPPSHREPAMKPTTSP